MSVIEKHVDTDAELVILITSGNHQAFAQLYDRYKTVLYLHAKRMFNDEDEMQIKYGAKRRL